MMMAQITSNADTSGVGWWAPDAGASRQRETNARLRRHLHVPQALLALCIGRGVLRPPPLQLIQPALPLPAPEPDGSARCYWNGYGTQRNRPAQGQPLLEPGGSARCYWNGYGTQRNRPAQGQPLLEPGGSARCYRNGYGTQRNRPAQGQSYLGRGRPIRHADTLHQLYTVLDKPYTFIG